MKLYSCVCVHLIAQHAQVYFCVCILKKNKEFNQNIIRNNYNTKLYSCHKIGNLTNSYLEC